jgi:uncharacterized RDD family membrane protein YckC
MSSDRPTLDLYDIGWWIESTDDEVYGPVSRKSLVRLLTSEIISPNTLVRHCTEQMKRPAVDVAGVREALPSGVNFLPHGDRLSEAWPSRKTEQLAAAQASIPCVWKNRPAILVCLRCGAPYCEKYRAKPLKKQFYFCKRCQAQLSNRRACAILLDVFLLYLASVLAFAAVVTVIRQPSVAPFAPQVMLAAYYGTVALFWLLFIFRDRMGGLGKRILGLRVVQARDGESQLTYGQAFIRWLSEMIPIFNLIDWSVPYRDPLMRRFGDRWAGTRVIDTQRRLSQIRWRILDRLRRKKGVQLLNPVQTPLSEFARTAG